MWEQENDVKMSKIEETVTSNVTDGIIILIIIFSLFFCK